MEEVAEQIMGLFISIESLLQERSIVTGTLPFRDGRSEQRLVFLAIVKAFIDNFHHPLADGLLA